MGKTSWGLNCRSWRIKKEAAAKSDVDKNCTNGGHRKNGREPKCVSSWKQKSIDGKIIITLVSLAENLGLDCNSGQETQTLRQPQYFSIVQIDSWETET